MQKTINILLPYFCKIFYRPAYIGLENIPKDGSIVLAGNHTNNLDCILLISSTNRTIHFLAKDELIKGFSRKEELQEYQEGTIYTYVPKDLIEDLYKYLKQ